MRDPRVPGQQLDGLQALDKLTRFVSEDLARGLNRRSFLRRAGGSAFAFMITLATGRLFTARSTAQAADGTIGLRPAPAPIGTIICTPPGPFCNTGGGPLSGCHGAHCFEHLYNGQLYTCRLTYNWFPVGCWTNSGNGGYWTCCDCRCADGIFCGCAQFSGNPAPLPSRPSG
jgi:hypothetical protein